MISGLKGLSGLASSVPEHMTIGKMYFNTVIVRDYLNLRDGQDSIVYKTQNHSRKAGQGEVMMYYIVDTGCILKEEVMTKDSFTLAQRMEDCIILDGQAIQPIIWHNIRESTMMWCTTQNIEFNLKHWAALAILGQVFKWDKMDDWQADFYKPAKLHPLWEMLIGTGSPAEVSRTLSRNSSPATMADLDYITIIAQSGISNIFGDKNEFMTLLKNMGKKKTKKEYIVATYDCFVSNFSFHKNRYDPNEKNNWSRGGLEFWQTYTSSDQEVTLRDHTKKWVEVRESEEEMSQTSITDSTTTQPYVAQSSGFMVDSNSEHSMFSDTVIDIINETLEKTKWAESESDTDSLEVYDQADPIELLNELIRLIEEEEEEEE
jgi:hypothetical protein